MAYIFACWKSNTFPIQIVTPVLVGDILAANKELWRYKGQHLGGKHFYMAGQHLQQGNSQIVSRPHGDMTAQHEGPPIASLTQVRSE